MELQIAVRACSAPGGEIMGSDCQNVEVEASILSTSCFDYETVALDNLANLQKDGIDHGPDCECYNCAYGASGALRCEINNGGCWKKNTRWENLLCLHIVQEDHSKGCKCPPGFKDVDESAKKSLPANVLSANASTPGVVMSAAAVAMHCICESMIHVKRV
ncbi:uncharacterized protein LOC122070272 isoform X2 [Macadamia integrifolia]|uniref:uncharacterized protein LOC122070272 isoform X2 n=1 Tax=Macadamia integrifolia TaxID=60698 RepID=UPI001C4FB271|nr:uncharacterized protein LOC122070272 isoform X2 [Macadamia integrifolia]